MLGYPRERRLVVQPRRRGPAHITVRVVLSHPGQQGLVDQPRHHNPAHNPIYIVLSHPGQQVLIIHPQHSSHTHVGFDGPCAQGTPDGRGGTTASSITPQARRTPRAEHDPRHTGHEVEGLG